MPSGPWFPFGDVECQTGDRSLFCKVSTAEVNGELHVAGVNTAGQLWQVIRRTNESWTPFGDVEEQTGDRGSFLTVSVDGLFTP